jgi:tRNA (guanine-N7-)-methyltransferase
MPESGDRDCDYGIPIPGDELPPDRWAITALKQLPELGPLDIETIFGRKAPLAVELGCGNARWTISSALSRPGFDHLALDVLPVGIRYATRRANRRGLANVRIAVKDAQTFVRDYLPAGRTREIHVYHPQPYHNPREARLRLIQPTFLADVHRALEPDGLFVVQTDSPEYWQYIRQAVSVLFTFSEHPDPWPDAPHVRTRREIYARLRGLRVFRGIGERSADSPDPERLAAWIESIPEPTFQTKPRRGTSRHRRTPGR